MLITLALQIQVYNSYYYYIIILHIVVFAISILYHQIKDYKDISCIVHINMTTQCAGQDLSTHVIIHSNSATPL